MHDNIAAHVGCATACHGAAEAISGQPAMARTTVDNAPGSPISASMLAAGSAREIVIREAGLLSITVRILVPCL